MIFTRFSTPCKRRDAASVCVRVCRVVSVCPDYFNVRFSLFFLFFVLFFFFPSSHSSSQRPYETVKVPRMSHVRALRVSVVLFFFFEFVFFESIVSRSCCVALPLFAFAVSLSASCSLQILTASLWHLLTQTGLSLSMLLVLPSFSLSCSTLCSELLLLLHPPPPFISHLPNSLHPSHILQNGSRYPQPSRGSLPLHL